MRHLGYLLTLLMLVPACYADHNGGDLLAGGTPSTSGQFGGGDVTGGRSTGASSTTGGPQPNASSTPMPGAAVCTTDLQVCDDFETQSVGQSPNATWWNVQTQNANESVLIDATRAYSGHQSLHIHTTNNGYERAVIVNQTIFPESNNTFYGRVFFYLDGNQPQTHFNLVDASGTLAGQSQPTNVVYGGQVGMFLANYYNANDPSNVLDEWQHAGVDSNNTWIDTTAVPTNRWACLEWEFAGPSNAMYMWLDGNPVDTMTLVGTSKDCCPTVTWTQPTFAEVALGWTIVGNTEAFTQFDYWLDGVALDSNRIGCQ